MEDRVLNALFSGPYFVLIVGVIFTLWGAIMIETRRTWSRYRGWIYRDEAPGKFWSDVAVCFIAAAGFLGYFVYLGTTIGYPRFW